MQMGLNPFDWTGGPFLSLYGILFFLTIIAGFAIPAWLRPEGDARRVTNPDELAILAGGRIRFVEALASRLLTSGALVLDRKKFRSGRGEPDQATVAERSVLALPTPMNWQQLQRGVAHYAEPVERRLIDAGLLITQGEAWQLRFFQTLPYLLLLGFGITKWQIGLLRDKPVGFLIGLLVVTAFFAWIRFLAVDRKTREGKAALAQAKARSDRLRRAPMSEEAGLAVALFGTGVLAASAWADFHKLRAASGDSGGGGGGDSGGCGGGGCGGCGG